MTSQPQVRVWVDGDACPAAVKEIIFRSAKRRPIKVTVIANQSLHVPKLPNVDMVLVPHGADVADDKIVESMGEGDVVITGDILLAARIVAKDGTAIGTRGELFDDDTVHDRLASRDLMEKFRAAGVETSGPKPQAAKDVQAFANTFDRVVTRLLRIKSRSTRSKADDIG